jgi:hypothetical protein
MATSCSSIRPSWAEEHQCSLQDSILPEGRNTEPLTASHSGGAASPRSSPLPEEVYLSPLSRRLLNRRPMRRAHCRRTEMAWRKPLRCRFGQHSRTHRSGFLILRASRRRHDHAGVRLINLGGSPQRVDDEGTYVAQAYAVSRLGDLSHYTYWYDHPPLGWIQIAVWGKAHLRLQPLRRRDSRGSGVHRRGRCRPPQPCSSSWRGASASPVRRRELQF